MTGIYLGHKETPIQQYCAWYITRSVRSLKRMTPNESSVIQSI